MYRTLFLFRRIFQMIEVTNAGKDQFGSWLDVAERPFGIDVEIRVIRRVRVPDVMTASAYEKKGDVTTFADLRPDLFRSR